MNLWDHLPAENMRLRRLTSDDVIASIIGVLDAEQVRAVRATFGLEGGAATTGAEAFEAIMERGNALANGWKLTRRCLIGRNRVEIEGPADVDLPALRRMGWTVEIVSWRTHVFAPNSGAMARILNRRDADPDAVVDASPPLGVANTDQINRHHVALSALLTDNCVEPSFLPAFRDAMI